MKALLTSTYCELCEGEKEESTHLSTGSAKLDNLLGGGLPIGKITSITSGPHASDITANLVTSLMRHWTGKRVFLVDLLCDMDHTHLEESIRQGSAVFNARTPAQLGAVDNLQPDVLIVHGLSYLDAGTYPASLARFLASWLPRRKSGTLVVTYPHRAYGVYTKCLAVGYASHRILHAEINSLHTEFTLEVTKSVDASTPTKAVSFPTKEGLGLMPGNFESLF